MPITDLEVGPDGNIYLTTGGGQGQGGLYKITWTGAKPGSPTCRDSRGRASAAAAFQLGLGRDRESQGVDGRIVRARARKPRATPPPRRTTACGPARDAAARRVAERGAPGGARIATPTSRAAAVYVVGLPRATTPRRLPSGLKDANALVLRRAAEALVRQGLPTAPSFAPVADIYALLRSGDRFVRYSGRVALEHTPRNEWSKMVMAETNVTALTEGLVALANTASEAQAQSELRPVFEKLVSLMQRTSLTPDEKIRVLGPSKSRSRRARRESTPT